VKPNIDDVGAEAFAPVAKIYRSARASRQRVRGHCTYGKYLHRGETEDEFLLSAHVRPPR